MAATTKLKIAGAAQGEGEEEPLAPWPAIDRYPIVIGPGLSLAYISSIFRLSLVGYRQQYVDLLDELLEKEPHGFSVVSKRVLSVAGGQLELTPAEDVDDSEVELAKEICKACTRAVRAIPDLAQHLAALSWATYYSLAALETHWEADAHGFWAPARLSFVHSRRLAFPVSGSWDLFIWDQGNIGVPSSYGTTPTTSGTYGLRVKDFPGKFVVHAPQIRGNYPTRDGLGRQLAYWFALKLIATRGAPQYLERFAKPWPEAVFKTGTDGNPGRPASKEDIDRAVTALKEMGAGTLASWVHPDTVELNLKTPDQGRPKLTFREWIEICNAEISKAVLGGTLTTEVGSTGGNRALGDTQKKGELTVYKQDARMLADTLRRDLVSWIVKLNYPGFERLTPCVSIHVEDPPDPTKIIEKAAKAAACGMPVDADAVARQAGVPLVEAGDLEARRLAPYGILTDPAAYDLDLAARREQVSKEYPRETPEALKPGAFGDGDTSDNNPPAANEGEGEGDDEDPSEGE